MGILLRVLFIRLIGFCLTWVVRIFGLVGLILLAVVVGIFGGLWVQSDHVTITALAISGLSFLGGHVQGTFYWIVRVVLFALMLVFWVISCFIVVWVSQSAGGFGV